MLHLTCRVLSTNLHPAPNRAVHAVVESLLAVRCMSQLALHTPNAGINYIMDKLIRQDGKHDGSSYYYFGDGHYYCVTGDSASSIYLSCKKTSCRGKARLVDDHFQCTRPHNHPPDGSYSEVQAHRQEIMNEAMSVTSYVPFSEIIRREQRRTPNPDVRSRLTLRSLRPAMQRSRSNVFPTLPNNLRELSQILEDPQFRYITSSIDMTDNIYLGTAVGYDGSHSIVFISSRSLNLLCTVETIFADGTFYITPSVGGCYQVFTLVTIHDHTVIALCWCLMDGKSQAGYESVLLLLRAALPHWRLTKAISDFEDAIINAFRNVFGIEVQGCLFHSATAMTKKAKNIIGVQVIRFFPEVDMIVRLCCALPLLPQTLLQRGLNVIGYVAMIIGPWFLYAIVRPFLGYMQEEWLDHATRGPSMSVCESENRTNNASETNNHRMNQKIGIHHPNTFHFVRQVANFEQESMDDVMTLARGLIPTRHRAVSSISNDAFIKRITRELLQDADPSDDSILRFLAGASLAIRGTVNNGLL